MNVLITGGAGFIGANLVLHWIKEHPNDLVINFDALTYAGNLMNLKDVENHPSYRFFKGDLCVPEDIKQAFDQYHIDAVIHLAAESHVDRSISGPGQFIQTNIVGTYNLLEAARQFWQESTSNNRFHYVNTDEVYGSLGETGFFTETTAYAPNSPYSASKASGGHLVRAYQHTYKMNTVTTSCSNNYGPYQFPEKLIPLIIQNCLEGKPIPVYGDGSNVRDWLYVKDHCSAIDVAFHNSQSGEVYNIGGLNEWKNIDIVQYICGELDKALGRSSQNSCKNLITFVKDRPGHDQRYAIDASKIEKDLNWKPHYTFESGLRETIQWYLDNQDWAKSVTSGSYQIYYKQQYEER